MEGSQTLISQHVQIAPLLPGTKLYKYHLLRPIGAGSFGEVWLAEDQALGHEYAIKISKFGIPVHKGLREAQIGHALDHGNLVKVHYADVVSHGDNDLVIIVMDYMQNGSITGLANPSIYLPILDVVRLGIDILRGLECLHNKDFIHNDVKPENVLIGPQKQGMLTDYGISGVTQNGALVEPNSFYEIHAAPEILNQDGITAQTDVFQTGLTLFRLLIGLNVLKQKFDTLGKQAYYDAIKQENLVKAADFPAYVPSRLRRIVLNALKPDLGQRFSTALAMRRELEKLNYPGYWTVKETREFVGYNGDYEYRYEKIKKSKNNYKVLTFKKNKKTSRRESRFTKFCSSSLKNAEAEKQINRFIKAVIEGF